MADLKLCEEARILSRFTNRYATAIDLLNSSTSDGEKQLNRVYVNSIICCFGDCFDLTFNDAETYLKENAK